MANHGNYPLHHGFLGDYYGLIPWASPQTSPPFSPPARLDCFGLDDGIKPTILWGDIHVDMLYIFIYVDR
jgi:hypothetical protein